MNLLSEEQLVDPEERLPEPLFFGVLVGDVPSVLQDLIVVLGAVNRHLTATMAVENGEQRFVFHGFGNVSIFLKVQKS